VHSNSPQWWRYAASLFVCLMISISGISSLHAQNAAGTIQGSATDQSGHAIQGASVAVISATQVEKRVITGADGKFTATGLPAGTYTVQVSATGFATESKHNVAVASESVVSVPVTLSIASVSQEVTVEAEADTSIAAQLSPVMTGTRHSRPVAAEVALARCSGAIERPPRAHSGSPGK